MTQQLLVQYDLELRYLASRLADRWRVDRDDVRQDLYLLMLTHGSKFDPCRGSLRRWLKWRWYNLQRQSQTIGFLSGDLLNELCIDGNDPATAILAKDELQRIRHAVSALPAKERDLIRQHFGLENLERMTLSEIAAHHGITPQCVSKRRQVCYSRLRRLLR